MSKAMKFKVLGGIVKPYDKVFFLHVNARTMQLIITPATVSSVEYQEHEEMICLQLSSSESNTSLEPYDNVAVDTAEGKIQLSERAYLYCLGEMQRHGDIAVKFWQQADTFIKFSQMMKKEASKAKKSRCHGRRQEKIMTKRSATKRLKRCKSVFRAEGGYGTLFQCQLKQGHEGIHYIEPFGKCEHITPISWSDNQAYISIKTQGQQTSSTEQEESQ